MDAWHFRYVLLSVVGTLVNDLKLWLMDVPVTALWDNRITQHIASWDYEGDEARHGTRVVSLAEKPFFDPNAPTRRQALGLNT